MKQKENNPLILTAREYSQRFLFEGKRVSERTVIRRCSADMLPSGHQARKLPFHKNGAWVITVPEQSINVSSDFQTLLQSVLLCDSNK